VCHEVHFFSCFSLDKSVNMGFIKSLIYLEETAGAYSTKVWTNNLQANSLVTNTNQKYCVPQKLLVNLYFTIPYLQVTSDVFIIYKCSVPQKYYY
jgi:hypothetical protein